MCVVLLPLVLAVPLFLPSVLVFLFLFQLLVSRFPDLCVSFFCSRVCLSCFLFGVVALVLLLFLLFLPLLPLLFLNE